MKMDPALEHNTANNNFFVALHFILRSSSFLSSHLPPAVSTMHLFPEIIVIKTQISRVSFGQFEPVTTQRTKPFSGTERVGSFQFFAERVKTTLQHVPPWSILPTSLLQELKCILHNLSLHKPPPFSIHSPLSNWKLPKRLCKLPSWPSFFQPLASGEQFRCLNRHT